MYMYIFFSSSLKWFCSFAFWHWYHRKCFLCYCQLPVMNSLMNCLKQHLYWTSRGRWSPSDSGTKTVQGRCSLSVAHIKSDVCNRYTHCLYNSNDLISNHLTVHFILVRVLSQVSQHPIQPSSKQILHTSSKSCAFIF